MINKSKILPFIENQDHIWKGNQNTFISGVSDIRKNSENSLTWIKNINDDLIKLLDLHQNGIVVGPRELEDKINPSSSNLYLLCDDPKLVFSKIVSSFFAKNKKPKIHPTAIISDEAKIGKNAYIGPYTVIGNSRIGDNCMIEAFVHIQDNTEIGDDLIINSFVNIGGDGCGFSSNKESAPIKFPHIGGVKIGNRVEIGSNSSIDKGALGNTIIEDDVKIDNFVHIAHNCQIRQCTIITANSMIAGSVTIGQNVWIAPSVSVINGVTIGDKATVGMGAVVTKNIPEGETWAGNPAKPTSELKKLNNNIKQLIENLNKKA